jgi:hypothetical protein
LNRNDTIHLEQLLYYSFIPVENIGAQNGQPKTVITWEAMHCFQKVCCNGNGYIQNGLYINNKTAAAVVFLIGRKRDKNVSS